MMTRYYCHAAANRDWFCSMIVTTIVHASGMAIGLSWLAKVRSNPQVANSKLDRALVVAVLVLIMFLATLIEAGIWAIVFFVLGAFSDLEEALYFSTVTYTTLSYGYIVLEEPWRLLSSFEAANGTIMFGWTTALIVVAIHRFVRHYRELKRSTDSGQGYGVRFIWFE